MSRVICRSVWILSIVGMMATALDIAYLLSTHPDSRSQAAYYVLSVWCAVAGIGLATKFLLGRIMTGLICLFYAPQLFLMGMLLNPAGEGEWQRFFRMVAMASVLGAVAYFNLFNRAYRGYTRRA